MYSALLILHFLFWKTVFLVKRLFMSACSIFNFNEITNIKNFLIFIA